MPKFEDIIREVKAEAKALRKQGRKISRADVDREVVRRSRNLRAAPMAGRKVKEKDRPE